jgi:hypothetical protein
MSYSSATVYINHIANNHSGVFGASGHVRHHNFAPAELALSIIHLLGKLMNYYDRCKMQLWYCWRSP